MISGVINVYKEAGFTSHDVVAKLRGILHQKKIGHTGTLDPDAVGVLPVCLGKATKLVETLTGGTKTYEAVLLLGRETDTQDAGGETVAEAPVTCREEDVQAVLKEFLGEQDQIPPMYSAKKQNGKRLYQLARNGIEVERRPARIRIDELEMLSCDLPRVKIRVTCSGGTYIRTLCHDIGRRLGCGGCMEHLLRTRVGGFAVEKAVTLDVIRNKVEEGSLSDILLTPDSFFEELPAVQTEAAMDRLVHNGNPLPAGAGAERIRLYDSAGIFMGVYRYRESGQGYYPDLFFYETETGIK